MNEHMALLPILSDPTRLDIIATLQAGEASVGAITQTLNIAQSGVSRHLAILHKAGVVTVRADGQRRLYALRSEPFQGLEAWLAGFHSLWSARLDRLAGAVTAHQLTKAKDD